MSSFRLMFPEVRSSLLFSGFGLKPHGSGFQSYSYSSLKTSPSPFKDNGLLFWVPRVLCQHSEVVLWNLLSVQMFFWWICWGESGLPVVFLHHLRTSDQQTSRRYSEWWQLPFRCLHSVFSVTAASFLKQQLTPVLRSRLKKNGQVCITTS